MANVIRILSTYNNEILNMHACMCKCEDVHVKTRRFTFGIWNWNLFLGALLLRGDDRYDGV